MFFHTPLLLLLLLFPLGFFIRSLAKENDPFKNFFTKEIREKLFLPAQTFTSQTKYHLFLLVIVLFIIALARPVKIMPSLDITQSNPSVILAIDMSRSMGKTDIFPSRQAFAKAKAETFIQKATSYNIAVIFYANDAYMLYPLSQEKDLLLSLLKDANITQKFAKNTNLFAALEASNFLLQTPQNKHIVLFSDGGEDVVKTEELNFLKSKDITLSTLATTPKTNRALQNLCNKSSGLYQPFTWSDKDISTLIQHINLSEKTAQKVHHDIPQFQEYFSFPLALALLFLALLFFPLNISTFVLFLAYIQPAPLHAGVFDFWHIHQAQKENARKNYAEAIKHYQQIKLTAKTEYNLAYTLYKDAKYHEAIKHYKKALGINKKMDSKVYYNIATAYARQNKLDFAKDFYKKSLTLHPRKITQDNLDVVTQVLKKQKKNRHKKNEKLHFKAIGDNASKNNNPFSNYSIKLHNFMPSEEERWFQKVAKHKSPTYLQKIKTTKRSIDANISW